MVNSGGNTMKKIISFFAMAAMLLVSCTKEMESGAGDVNSGDTVFAPGKYTFNVEVLETKAVKTAWENGDKIFVFFDDAATKAAADVASLPYVTLNFDGEDWVVCEGHAYKVYTDAGRTWFYAAQAIGKCTDSSMSREEKLRAAFDYIKTSYLEGVPHDPPYRELDWPVVCANDLFVYGKGDCFSYGAAFAYMAKAIGYEDVYACNSGGHGWAEIEGKYYDPEWDMHHNEYNHFGVAPGDECDVKYAASLMDGVEWMRMAV